MSKTAEFALDNLCRSMGRQEASAQWREMQKAADTRLLQDIVEDSRRGAAATRSVTPKVTISGAGVTVDGGPGSGWTEPRPLRPPEGVEHIDRIAEAFDRRDRAKGLL